MIGRFVLALHVVRAEAIKSISLVVFLCGVIADGLDAWLVSDYPFDKSKSTGIEGDEEEAER